MSRYTMHTREIESIDFPQAQPSAAALTFGAFVAALAVLALVLVLFTL